MTCASVGLNPDCATRGAGCGAGAPVPSGAAGGTPALGRPGDRVDTPKGDAGAPADAPNGLFGGACVPGDAAAADAPNGDDPGLGRAVPAAGGVAAALDTGKRGDTDRCEQPRGGQHSAWGPCAPVRELGAEVGGQGRRGVGGALWASSRFVGAVVARRVGKSEPWCFALGRRARERTALQSLAAKASTSGAAVAGWRRRRPEQPRLASACDTAACCACPWRGGTPPERVLLRASCGAVPVCADATLAPRAPPLRRYGRPRAGAACPGGRLRLRHRAAGQQVRFFFLALALLMLVLTRHSSLLVAPPSQRPRPVPDRADEPPGAGSDQLGHGRGRQSGREGP
jgi:hypothetical protein